MAKFLYRNESLSGNAGSLVLINFKDIEVKLECMTIITKCLYSQVMSEV